MQDLPNGGGGRTPSPEGASRVGLCSRGGGANSGGAPMQALAPGRWRPSVRHCFYPCKLGVNDRNFNCVEQYLVSEMARCCDDHQTASTAMTLEDPAQMKKNLQENFNTIVKGWPNGTKSVNRSPHRE